MQKLTQRELNEVIRKHYKWLRGEEGGEKADLSNKDLSGLDLSGISLHYADLTEANFTGATLRRATLRRATLTGANLTGANLTKADLACALLTGATLTDATLPDFQIPQDQDLIVWKKLREFYNNKTILCKLLIPADVARTASLVGKKCRAASAKVLEFQDINGNVLDLEEVAHETYNGDQDFFLYTKDEMVVPDEYNPDIRRECTHGIHFFMTKEEALNW